ncbi:MAG TPA: dickkopf-related protein [Polyangiales bacterium]|nr:dickkopf-related protein [Polyangiales bacterium]
MCNTCSARRMLLALSVLLSLAACAGSDSAADRRGAVTPVGAAGTSAAQSGGPGTPQSGVDNPSSMVTPVTPAMPGAAGAPARPVTPNTAITREPIAIDDCGANNPAGVSPADAQKLKAGSGSPGPIKWLYPYTGTVFPRGMLAPDLMWDGPAADVVHVHIKSKIFEYWGCLKPAAPGRLTLPQDVWDKAGQRSLGKEDDYLVEISLLSGGAVVGPAPVHIQIAQAAIKGSIYYNTYRSSLTGGAAPGGGFPGFPGVGGIPGGAGGTINGIVVRIPAAGRAEVFGQTDCNGCHSVSADGSLLLAQSVTGGAMSYELVANGMPMPSMAGPSGSWVALYPDGSAALSMSTVIDVARAGIFGGLGGMADATLFDTKTGQKLMSTGIPKGALMPFFSPDGTFLVFNDYAVDQAHGIALMRYDTKTHTASEHTVLYEEPAGTMRPAWPFVLPDNDGVVFVRTDDFDFTGGGVGVSGDIQAGAVAPFAELSIIDVKSKLVTVLAKAMGYDTPEDAAKGTTYLPFGVEDLHHAYYPTVSPVGAGGYFWVFFDSVRHYGNRGLQRQLWGAAIDISADGTYTRDPSHPAFYVSGQEFGTGNHRAFAALDPCRKDGDKCTSGIDCCGGSCYIESAAELVDPVGTCSPQKRMCANKDERCTTDADCCPPPDGQLPYSCIAGFCAYVTGPA